MSRPAAEGALRVLLADDGGLARELAESLADESRVDVVGHARRDAEALALVSACSPELVLVTASDAEESRAEAIRRILSEGPDTRVLVVLRSPSLESIRGAAGAGAIGYVVADDLPAPIAGVVMRLASR